MANPFVSEMTGPRLIVTADQMLLARLFLVLKFLTDVYKKILIIAINLSTIQC